MNGAGEFDELNSEALAAVAECEGRVQQLTRQLEALQGRLDGERRRLGAALDELSVRYLYTQATDPNGAGPAGGGINLETLRGAVRSLDEQLLQCGTFGSKLGNLTNLLTISRGQFAPQGVASAELDVVKLVSRMAMIKAQEVERSHLAREVHDGPAQVLANAILGLELCEQIARRSPEQLIDEVARLKGMVREGLVEVRRFIFDLRPSTLAERGLAVTLQRYVTDYQSFFGIKVDLALPEQLPALTADQEITVFRVVQEALQNIHKHARASIVTIGLELAGETLVARVRDNGRGFTPKQNEITTMSGAGLGGMHERAEAIGGEFRIESEPGQGTTVLLSFPYAPPETTAPPGAATRRPGGALAGDAGAGRHAPLGEGPGD